VLQAVAPFAERHGVLLCVENVFTRNSVADVKDCAVLFEVAVDEQIRFTLDSGHANMYGCLFGMLDQVQERLAFTHLHDNDGVKDQHLAPGNGAINWQRFMRYLDRCGYMGPLNFELREACDLPRTIAMLEAMGQGFPAPSGVQGCSDRRGKR
jgi:sugar phosphate isomerase/epimerase